MNQPGTHKLTDALDGQTPAPIDAQTGNKPTDAPGTPGQETGAEVAEATRREQASQDNGKNDLDRDSHLVQVGRGHQTHG